MQKVVLEIIKGVTKDTTPCGTCYTVESDIYECIVIIKDKNRFLDDVTRRTHYWKLCSIDYKHKILSISNGTTWREVGFDDADIIVHHKISQFI